MTAPTHVAFAVALGLFGGAPSYALPILAGGAILPDIDHPQSALGRIFFFLSIPLNRAAGHRRTVHGFALWGVCTACGLIWEPLAWIGAGALSHVFLDCLNVSGVQALAPFSERVCVLFRRQWRIVTGSRQELVLMCVLGALAWSGGYIGSMGGMRAMIGVLTGSYKIAHQQLKSAGLEQCEIEGRLRFPTGEIVEGRWLCIGTEGTGMALEYEGRILHAPRQAELLRARLKKTGRRWNTAKIGGFARAKRPLYFYDGKEWGKAMENGIIHGHALGERIEIEQL